MIPFRRTFPRVAWLALCLLLPVNASGEAPELKDPPELKALKYRLLGPAWGGRATRAAGVPGDPNTLYLATASGGVWKSADGGRSFQPIFDEQPISSIGSLALAPSDPNVLYVGSGEANIRGNVAAGNGIYKSVDAGKTWNHVWKQEGQIGAMVVDPRNADVAFAAVLGHAFGPNPERGVYRTRDGGKSWEQVLRKDDDTGASDVALDPSNPRILFAGLWQTRRTPWSLHSGGSGSGLYMSRDGGDTWKQLIGDGLPEGIWGKVGVAVAPSDGRRVYALIEAEEGGLFRSDDGGENWTRASASRLLRQRAWYYSSLTVHPENPDEVWCPQVQLLRSIDGGKNFTIVSASRLGWDHHSMWIDPRNGKRLLGADDSGISISTDGGQSWFRGSLPIGQFYHVSTDNRAPFRVSGTLQDFGSAQGPSHSLDSTGIRNTDWYSVGGGEAGHVVSDPSDPNIVYAGEYGGIITRYDHRTRQSRNVSIYPENPSGHGAEDLRYRFQWTAPILISPHDPKVVYHAGNVLFRTSDGGQNWTAISADLTRNDKSKQQWSGGPITGDNTGVEIYGTLFAVAESPLEKGLLWVGSDDGLVHVSRDGGGNWKNVTAAIPGMPEWGTVSMIEASRLDAGTAWLVVDAHRLDDMQPYLYGTTDYGRTWKRLDGTLPRDIYLHAVRQDPAQRGMLYLGTERGVALSRDGGATWQSLRLNLPTVAVHDLAVKDDSLVVGTHGRSAWVLDSLRPVRELSAEVASKALHLFSTPEVTQWRLQSGLAGGWAADNPPSGAVIHYFLKDKPQGELKAEIVDARGKVIRTLSSKPRAPIGAGDDLEDEKEGLEKAAWPADAGVQTGIWDLTHDGAELIPGAKIDWGTIEGPSALPGDYTVRVSVDGQSASAALRVVQDPRVTVAARELQGQLDVSLALRDELTRLTRSVVRLRTLRQQLQAHNPLLGQDARAAQLVKDSSALIEKLDRLEEQMHNPRAEVVYDILAMKGGAKLYSRLSFLYMNSLWGDGPPTQGQREVWAEQRRELEGYQSQLRRLIETELEALNQQARKLDVPHILVPK